MTRAGLPSRWVSSRSEQTESLPLHHNIILFLALCIRFTLCRVRCCSLCASILILLALCHRRSRISTSCHLSIHLSRAHTPSKRELESSPTLVFLTLSLAAVCHGPYPTLILSLSCRSLHTHILSLTRTFAPLGRVNYLSLFDIDCQPFVCFFFLFAGTPGSGCSMHVCTFGECRVGRHSV